MLGPISKRLQDHAASLQHCWHLSPAGVLRSRVEHEESCLVRGLVSQNVASNYPRPGRPRMVSLSDVGVVPGPFEHILFIPWRGVSSPSTSVSAGKQSVERSGRRRGDGGSYRLHFSAIASSTMFPPPFTSVLPLRVGSWVTTKR